MWIWIYSVHFPCHINQMLIHLSKYLILHAMTGWLWGDMPAVIIIIHLSTTPEKQNGFQHFKANVLQVEIKKQKQIYHLWVCPQKFSLDIHRDWN